MYIGIDPGLKGGISVYLKNENDSEENFYCYEMPITKENQLDINKIIEILKPLSDKGTCFIEKSQAMPGQGVVSMFNYGKNYGILIGLLSAYNIQIVEVSPVSWKKHFYLIKKDKTESVKLADSLNNKEKWKTERGRLLDGKAESFLILKYGMDKKLEKKERKIKRKNQLKK